MDPRPLVLDDVVKQYGEDAPVLDGLSHTFAPGTLTMLSGPNGSGKTTLLRVLSVLAFPTRGMVRYGDIDVHAHPYRYLQHVGIVHAEATLPEHLTAVELLEWVLRSRDRWSDSAPDRITALLDRLHLDERRVNLIRTFSSGMVKKAQIAAALIPAPHVLLMDEPLRSLDSATTDAALGLLHDFVADDGVAVVASHLQSELSTLADAVIEMGAERKS